MKVRLLVSLSDGRQAGDILECSEDEAGRMIASRFALPFSEEKTERAVKPSAPERRKRA